MKRNMDTVMVEYKARRKFLATGTLNITELFDKAVELLEFTFKNHIGKGKTDEQKYR